MTSEEIRARVREKIAAMVSLPATRIESTMTLTGDLPFDSLQLYELAATLEDEFGLPELDADEISQIETVGQVEQRVLDLLAVEPDRTGG